VKPCQNCTTRDTQLVASTNSQADTRRTFIQQLMHTPEQAVAEPKNDPLGDYCEATHPRIRNAAYSRTHGYDLGTADDTLTGDPLGYYAFTYTLGPDRNAVFVVLDSEELDDHVGGIAGHIKHEQLSWLQRVLACVHDKHSSDLVFVFAHQPLSMLQVDAQDTTMDVEATLRSSRNVIAYLFGHNHTNSICNDNRVDANGRRTTCTRFWEIETSSLIEFPQEARMVRIKQAAQNLGFLEVSTFQENLSSATAQMRQFLELAHRGAERDFCVTHNARCSADQRVYREDGDSTTARLFFRMP
jgi:3',5'-cyclic AMP phosphodiesterase CpdA